MQIYKHLRWLSSVVAVINITYFSLNLGFRLGRLDVHASPGITGTKKNWSSISRWRWRARRWNSVNKAFIRQAENKKSTSVDEWKPPDNDTATSSPFQKRTSKILWPSRESIQFNFNLLKFHRVTQLRGQHDYVIYLLRGLKVRNAHSVRGSSDDDIIDEEERA